MELPVKGIGRDELVSTRLRSLFDKRGFRRIRVNKFEDYTLYVENRNFLQSESIITFMDLTGKLLALKPDITLSIVKSVSKNEPPSLEKLYYVDEVFRLSRENREYKVCNQIGMEIIGRADPFSNIEAVSLALSSLALISGSFVLDISHLGFISGLLEQIELPLSARQQVLNAIHRRSLHDVAAALDLAGVPETLRRRVIALGGLRGNFVESLPQAKSLVNCAPMQEAYEELEQLGCALKNTPLAKHLQLDFSVVNDLDYYNGLILLGYVEGIPKVALTGGRYDNLMKKMGRQSSAIGFAVSLDDLNTYLNSGKKFDFDVLITYCDGCNYALLLDAAGKLFEAGHSVRLENENSDLSAAGFTWEKRCRFDGNAIKEVGEC